MLFWVYPITILKYKLNLKHCPETPLNRNKSKIPRNATELCEPVGPENFENGVRFLNVSDSISSTPYNWLAILKPSAKIYGVQTIAIPLTNIPQCFRPHVQEAEEADGPFHFCPFAFWIYDLYREKLLTLSCQIPALLSLKHSGWQHWMAYGARFKKVLLQ